MNLGRKLKRHEADLLKFAEGLGFEAVEFTGRTMSHLKLRHIETGVTTTISSSPRSPELAKRNAQQQLRRIARGGTQ